MAAGPAKRRWNGQQSLEMQSGHGMGLGQSHAAVRPVWQADQRAFMEMGLPLRREAENHLIIQADELLRTEQDNAQILSQS
jgi:hypothetical protein